MKKVVILFELKDWELKGILEESFSFSGEIYILEDFHAHDDALKRFIACQDITIITKWYHPHTGICTCSKDDYSEERKCFTYYQNADQADVIHQCSECPVQWKSVQRYIDAIPEQLSFLPTLLNEADGFKRIFPY